MFTCGQVRWLGGNGQRPGRAKADEYERLADGMIRNTRSDGPGDRAPYGMSDRSSGTGRLQSLRRTRDNGV